MSVCLVSVRLPRCSFIPRDCQQTEGIARTQTDRLIIHGVGYGGHWPCGRKTCPDGTFIALIVKKERQDQQLINSLIRRCQLRHGWVPWTASGNITILHSITPSGNCVLQNNNWFLNSVSSDDNSISYFVDSICNLINQSLQDKNRIHGTLLRSCGCGFDRPLVIYMLRRVRSTEYIFSGQINPCDMSPWVRAKPTQSRWYIKP